MKRIPIAFAYFLIVLLGSNQTLAARPCHDNNSHDESIQSLKVDISQSAEIVQSKNDHSKYRYLKLENQMQVLLVSDEKADKAAAALDVFVGSSHDPVKREGLAHFLEHMLFLGTDRYPEPDEYQAFISQHGGQHNAYTSFEHTNYFFDIDPAEFEPALDRFSRFFVAPLFNAEYVEREKNAVHSEYKARIKNDYRRQRDVFSQIVNPKHPSAKFSVGNLDTLADTPKSKVRDDLLLFYKQHYSANRMTLVVVAPNSLDELEAMVRGHFDAVPNYKSAQPKHGQPLFKKDSLPLLVSVEPVQELRTLSLTIPLPPVQDYFHEKPLAYIANLIGHEGEGSLLSLLKEEGLAEGLGAGVGLSDQSGSSFDITVGLTPDGLSNWQRVFDLIFQEIALVADQGIDQWRQQEQNALSDMQFRHQEIGDPINRVSQLANQLHRYPHTEVLRGPYLMDQFDGDRIVSLLALMKPENTLVTLVAPELKTSTVTTLYQVPYSVEALPKVSDNRPTKKLVLPEANDFVPENFALKYPSKSDQPGVPDLLIDKQSYRLWHYADHYYQVPKAQLYVAIKTPVIKNALNTAMADLYLRLVDERLNESSYAAALSGLGYHASRRSDGIGFVVSGFDDKLSLLVEDVTGGLLSPLQGSAKEEALIERLRKELVRNWRNGAKDTPYKQLLRETGVLLSTTSWQPEQLASALEGFDRKVFGQFVAELYNGATLEMFASGNLLNVDAEKLAEFLAGHFAGKPYKAWAERGVVQIPVGKKAQTHLSVDHKDSAILRYYQGRNDSVDEAAQILLMRQLLRSEFFNQLRTEQQLGYIVAVVDRMIDRVPGFGFLVQSPAVSVENLGVAIDQFLVDYKKKLGHMPTEEFERHRQAVLTGLKEKPKSLAEQSLRFWGSIDLRDYDFSRRKSLIASVEALSIEKISEAYKTMVLESGYSLQVDSNDGRLLSGDDIELDADIYRLPSRNL